MVYYSEKLIESLKMFFLLRDEIIDELQVLSRPSSNVESKIALKSLFIDLKSFIDELPVLEAILQKEPFEDYQKINEFLLLIDIPRKQLNRRKDAITKLRNTVFAHSYREDNRPKDFIHPMKTLKDQLISAPTLLTEIRYLGSLATIIINLALQYLDFYNVVLSDVINTNSNEIREINRIQKDNSNYVMNPSINEINKDIYHIEDSIKSHPDNIWVIAREIKCNKLRRKK